MKIKEGRKMDRKRGDGKEAGERSQHSPSGDESSQGRLLG